jgi:hypothetical protein
MKRSHRSHGLRGIHQSTSGKWSARIRINGRNKHLGCFTTSKEQAAAAYDSAARLNNENAVYNYDSPEDAELRIIWCRLAAGAPGTYRVYSSSTYTGSRPKRDAG